MLLSALLEGVMHVSSVLTPHVTHLVRRRVVEKGTSLR